MGKDGIGKPKGNILTRSKPFTLLVKHAFGVVDSNGTGEVGKAELYAGLLLVHLKLAKHAGPAACYPPSRKTCDDLFEAADADRSGTIDQDEFANIMCILCAQILSRILAYYAVLIFFVPKLAIQVIDYAAIPNGSYLEMAAEQVISLSVFFAVIPVIWNIIDTDTTRRIAVKTGSSSSTTTALSEANENKEGEEMPTKKSGSDKKGD